MKKKIFAAFTFLLLTACIFPLNSLAAKNEIELELPGFVIGEPEVLNQVEAPPVSKALAAHSHCVCGNSKEVGAHACGESLVYDKPLDSLYKGGTLASGNYYLTEDFVLENKIVVSGGTVNLCLNGHTLSGDYIAKVDAGILNICDCVGGGKAECTLSYAKGMIENHANFNVYSGEIITGSGTVVKTIGAGAVTSVYVGYVGATQGNSLCIAIELEYGTANVYGGSLEGFYTINVTTGNVNISGGNIEAMAWAITVDGSEAEVPPMIKISGNPTIRGYYAAVGMLANGVLEISGTPVLKGMYRACELSGGSKAYLSGAPIFEPYKGNTAIEIRDSDVTFSAKNMAQTESYSGETIILDVRTWSLDKPVITDVTEENSNKFVEESDGWLFRKVGDGLFIVKAHPHPICGESECTEHGEAVNFFSLDSTFTGGVLESGNFYLSENISLDEAIEISGTVNLCLNGYSLNADDAVFSVKQGASLNICDCNGSENEDGAVNGQASGISTEGAVHVYDGAINAMGDYGQAIAAYGGNVTVSGGVLTGVEGIHVSGADVVFTGSAEIAAEYRGIYMMTGNVNVSGGVINSADAGIYSSGTVNISAGEITGEMNGIYVRNGEVNLSGAPTITGGEADIYVTRPEKISAQSTTGEAYTGEVLYIDILSPENGDVIVKNIMSENEESFEVQIQCKTLASQDGNLIFADGHSLEKSEAELPTCTEEGSKEYWTCTVCDKVFNDEFGKQEIASETLVIPATGHVWNEAWTTDGDNHWHTCNHDGCEEVSELAAHNYQKEVTEPTCTTDGYTTYTCEVCGYSYQGNVTDALGHKTKLENEKEPTCTEKGYTGDTVCIRCREVLETGEKIAKTEHKYKNGKCKKCGKKDPNYQPEETETEKTEQGVKTGDESNIWVWSIWGLVSIGVIVNYIRRKVYLQIK